MTEIHNFIHSLTHEEENTTKKKKYEEEEENCERQVNERGSRSIEKKVPFSLPLFLRLTEK